ncbi:MAG: hypothetical protein BMS9Abin02_1501 [Anaerolineae bacterium]|nr:MAG: hypothetical protein BMS9Abin02_1501 [Anaerolineae bacterium]
MTRPSSPESTDLRLASWKRELKSDEKRRILEWAQRLGLSLYDEDVLPVTLQKLNQEAGFDRQGLSIGH